MDRLANQQVEGSDNAQSRGRSGRKMNWPLLRKFETLIFFCMMLLLPVFAVKVVNVTTTHLAVKNTAVDLVRDLIHAKQMAKDYTVNITVTSRPATPTDSCAYLIQDDQRTLEEVVLPKGVSLVGSVVFDPRGLPNSAASFIVTKGRLSAHVDVDTSGMISSP